MSEAVRRRALGGRFRYLLVVVGEAELALYDRRDTSEGAGVRRDIARLKGFERIFPSPLDAPLHVIAEAIAAHVGVPVTIGENWVWHESDDVSALREERK